MTRPHETHHGQDGQPSQAADAVGPSAPSPIADLTGGAEPAPTPGGSPVGAMHGRLREALASGAFSEGDGALLGVPVTMRAVLGEARVPVSRFLALGPGDTLPLDRLVGEPIDVTVNDATIARGEIVMLDEETGRLGVRVTALAGAA